MTAHDAFGPWAALDPVERRAQFRSLASITALVVGSAATVVETLRRAETDDAAGEQALEQFERLPSLTKRRILSTWGVVNFSRARP